MVAFAYFHTRVYYHMPQGLDDFLHLVAPFVGENRTFPCEFFPLFILGPTNFSLSLYLSRISSLFTNREYTTRTNSPDSEGPSKNMLSHVGTYGATR